MLMRPESRSSINFEEKPWACTKCQRERFKTRARLKKHWTDVHKAHPMPEFIPSARDSMKLNPDLEIPPEPRAARRKKKYKMDPADQRLYAGNQPKQSKTLNHIVTHGNANF